MWERGERFPSQRSASCNTPLNADTQIPSNDHQFVSFVGFNSSQSKPAGPGSAPLDMAGYAFCSNFCDTFAARPLAASMEGLRLN